MKFTIDESSTNHATIKVIGIGGGGCNAVNRMLNMNIQGVEFIVANTDIQALLNSNVDIQIQLGEHLTRGRGAGGKPQIGRDSAIEAEEIIRQNLQGTDLLFITAGMGGGTGTGAAPVIAQIAKELGLLTIGVVTTPFLFEGKIRSRYAEMGLRELENSVDTMIIVPNQKLLQIVEPDTSLLDSFQMANDVLGQAVQGISDLITVPGLINLDFTDLKTVMSDTGKALMGCGTASGDKRAELSVKKAIRSPLLDDLSIEGSERILVNISGGNDITLTETSQIMEVIYNSADENANIIFGTAIDHTLSNQIKVTVVATGFDDVTQENHHQINEIEEPLVIQKTPRKAKLGRYNSNHQSSQTPQKITPKNFKNHGPLFQTNNQKKGLEPKLESSSKKSESFRENVHFFNPEMNPGKRGTRNISNSTKSDFHLKSDAVNSPMENDNDKQNHSLIKLPDYQPRDLSKGSYNRKSVKSGEAIVIESSNYMIPAFLRRKPD